MTAPGPGYDFTTTTGATGPTLTSPGTYFVQVDAWLFNQTGETAGNCAVATVPPAGGSPMVLGPAAAWAAPNESDGRDSISGMVVVPNGAAPLQLQLRCFTNSGQFLTVDPATGWWFSPIASTSGTTVSAQTARR